MDEIIFLYDKNEYKLSCIANDLIKETNVRIYKNNELLKEGIYPALLNLNFIVINKKLSPTALKDITSVFKFFCIELDDGLIEVK